MNFWGYKRPDGKVGIRNHILILPASICASDTTRIIASQVEGAITFNNQNGCSQVPPDMKLTMDVLAGYAANPNIYGTVVVSLGCEGCQMNLVVEAIRERTNKPLKTLIIQEEGGTIKTVEKGVRYAQEKIADPAKVSIAVSDRHFGIGSDGLITIGPSDIADFRMRIYNADGSEAEMCGNGIRCVAKYVYDHKMTDKKKITIETGAGVKTLQLTVADGKVSLVRVDMGEPILKPDLIPVDASGEQVVDEPIEVEGREWKMTCVSMGNPHAVIFVEDTEHFELEKYGPEFEHHPRFPKRTNTEFVHVISPTEASMRVWERGSAETLACGTGTCATVMACILNHKTENKVLVHLRGGDLTIEYDPDNNHIYMTGPATEVFHGIWEEN